jgi:glycosyltransferase involved in cell wall biosynthesis
MVGGDCDVLFVQSSTELGGAERVLLNLMSGSPELRRRSLVATMQFGDGDLPQRLRAAGANVIELPKARIRQPVRLLRTVWTLRSIARQHAIRVIVGNGVHPQILGGLAARASGAKSMFLVHMIHRLPLTSNELLDQLALVGPCDLMLANSRASLAPLERLRPAVEKHILNLGTPISEVTAGAAREARAELGVEPHEVLIGVFGRLQRWKAQDVFVAAAASVAAVRPQARFVVVGGATFGLEPEYQAQLRETAAANGLSDRLTFTGFRQDVPRLMAACDIVCHTSRVPEPFGMVVIEAMSQGRPVIATRGGGPSEIFENEEQGLLVDPDQPRALAAAILALVDDPGRRARMGAQARERVQTAYSADVMAATVLEHVERLARTN